MIRDEARRADCPEHIALGIAGAESNWDPNAHGDGCHSYGLFQLYVNGGQGDPYSSNPDLLYHPRLNSRLAMPPIVNAYNWWEAQGYRGVDLIGLTAVYSGHPGRVPLSDPRVQRIVDYTLRLIFNKDGSWADWPTFNRRVCSDVVIPEIGPLPPPGPVTPFADLDPVEPPPWSIPAVGGLQPVAPPPAIS